VTDVAPTASTTTASPSDAAPTVDTVTASSAMSGPRLEQFEQEIRKLGVKGSKAEPERKLVVLGILAVLAGFIVAWLGVNTVRGAESQLEQGDGMALTIVGIGIAVVGAILWARYSLSRYLRYWLVRQIYEERASADRIVEAVRRVE